ncbi:serine/threonine-protein kinase mos-like [Liolophura sinensis]|uniref:serine/threonine-protein kinase mos-like n=1 Tax=Liolophura sinensis TaxID=3198878 RepID=UPI003158E51A
MEKKSLIGAGGFGSVYLGVFAKRKVAIKILDKRNDNGAAQGESFRAELRLLTLENDNIVKILAAKAQMMSSDGPAIVIMEYVPGRNLNDIINNPDELLPPKRRVKYALLLCYALDYAHRNNIVHLDVKPANLLITPDDKCKLGDFGCCQRVESETGTVSPTNRSTLSGTVAYRAPEVLRGQPPTFKADVYSVGITLWQMFSRQPPYGNEAHPHVIIFRVVAYNLRPELVDVKEDPFEVYYKDVYTTCWGACPKDRPSITDLIQVIDLWKHHL